MNGNLMVVIEFQRGVRGLRREKKGTVRVWSLGGDWRWEDSEERSGV